MRPRFHLTASDPTERQGTIEGDEAGHLIRVLRLGVGAEVDVLDGQGRVFSARVVSVARAAVRVALLDEVQAAPEPAVRISLALSALKADKMDAVIRDATMMGVFRIEPIVSARSETTRAALARGQRVSRWERIARSSVKQCGRAVAPGIGNPLALSDWLRQPHAGTPIVLLEPSAGVGRLMSDVPVTEAATVLIGPEGGWTAGEVAAIRDAGFVAVSLGGRILRADVAPLVALAALYEAWRAW